VALITVPSYGTSKHEKVGCRMKPSTPGCTMAKSKQNNTYEMRPSILRDRPGAITMSPQAMRVMYRAANDVWSSTQAQRWEEPEQWNEAEAVRLLQQTGALVAEPETQGAQQFQRELYHARLIAAHDSQDMAAYRIALNGYVTAAREACRKAKKERK
jgi:hypothetical protein